MAQIACSMTHVVTLLFADNPTQRSAGYNSQAQRHNIGDGRMRQVDAAVRSSVMARDDAFEGVSSATKISSAVRNVMKRADRDVGTSIVLVKDKKDRATVEQALDPKTRLVLFKMLNFGLFSAIHGCISTGKEANVYYAVNSTGTDYAIKVYKTSVLVFKDRDRYVTGDYRFRNGYCRYVSWRSAEYNRAVSLLLWDITINLG